MNKTRSKIISLIMKEKNGILIKLNKNQLSGSDNK